MLKKVVSLLACSLLLFAEKPLISIITSLWDGEEHLEGFLDDIVRQTIFDKCELVIINPIRSPGNEEKIIRKYLEKYPNILYLRPAKDPGIYGCWNYGIKLASSELISNANVDDRSAIDALEKHVEAMNCHPEIDVVYSGYYITPHANEKFETSKYTYYVDPLEFSKANMRKCLPGPRPVWRKSLHDRFGMFDVSFPTTGDWEFWCRAASQGSKFLRIPGRHTIFYDNPVGASSNPDEEKQKVRLLEGCRITEMYTSSWE